MSWSGRIELSLKIIGTLIAIFGIWKYFADRHDERVVAAQNRSLGYIERFGGSGLVAARGRLLTFWQDYPELVAATKEGKLTEDGYAAAIDKVYAAHENRKHVDDALFRMQVFLDEMSFCRSSAACDPVILDGFFCEYTQRFSRAYAPFYARLSRDIGAKPIDAGVQALAEDCAKQDE